MSRVIHCNWDLWANLAKGLVSTALEAFFHIPCELPSLWILCPCKWRACSLFGSVPNSVSCLWRSSFSEEWLTMLSSLMLFISSSQDCEVYAWLALPPFSWTQHKAFVLFVECSLRQISKCVPRSLWGEVDDVSNSEPFDENWMDIQFRRVGNYLV